MSVFPTGSGFEGLAPQGEAHRRGWGKTQAAGHRLAAGEGQLLPGFGRHLGGKGEQVGAGVAREVEVVDDLGEQWAGYFASRLAGYTNVRGGRYHTGMYTVSAHVPMGQNVGASPDGRKAATPLADGGLSPVYGRDMAGPTAVLQSVSRMSNEYTSNGGLLNLKLPEPDAMIGRTRGWLPETIDGWNAKRPGRGVGGGRPRKNK